MEAAAALRWKLFLFVLEFYSPKDIYNKQQRRPISRLLFLVFSKGKSDFKHSLYKLKPHFKVSFCDCTKNVKATFIQNFFSYILDFI